jgi:hypothetical protein
MMPDLAELRAVNWDGGLADAPSTLRDDILRYGRRRTRPARALPDGRMSDKGPARGKSECSLSTRSCANASRDNDQEAVGRSRHSPDKSAT